MIMAQRASIVNSVSGDQQSDAGFEKQDAEGDQDDGAAEREGQTEEKQRQRYFDAEPEEAYEGTAGDGEDQPEYETDENENKKQKKKDEHGQPPVKNFDFALNGFSI